MTETRELHLTAEQQEWVDSLPELPRSVFYRVPAGRKYRLTTTGQIVTPMAYADDGTVRVFVPADWNPDSPMAVLLGGLSVFGIDPNDLEFVGDE